jgi:hypothetical protein
MSAIERREQAAARYRPQRTRVLFVAEAPPDSEDRYFYFEEVYDRDHLWLALMKALYGEEFHRPARERTRKAYWLRRFQEDGCQLIDAVKEPLSGGHSKSADHPCTEGGIGLGSYGDRSKVHCAHQEHCMASASTRLQRCTITGRERRAAALSVFRTPTTIPRRLSWAGGKWTSCP